MKWTNDTGYYNELDVKQIIEKLIEETELLIAEDWATDKYPIEECLMMSKGVVNKLKANWLVGDSHD